LVGVVWKTLKRQESSSPDEYWIVNLPSAG
jgi:hypothetical protein